MIDQNKLSIAFVSDSIYPYFKGGKEKRIHEITTRLAAQGHAVTLYSMHWWEGPGEIVRDGVMLKAISPLYPLYFGQRRSIKEAVLFALHCFKLLGAKFDVIEVDHMPHLVLFSMKIVCLLKRKRLIVTWHEVWGKDYWVEYIGPGIKATMAYWIEAVSAKLPDLVISVSEHTRKKLATVLGRTRGVVVVHNGLDMEHILANRPAVKGADVVFAGRLLSHKNVDLLLQATAIVAKRHPDLSVWIIGEGPARTSLEELSKALGLERNVSFLGFLKGEDALYSVMKASKMFVLPSTREGFGIVALEANACGIPFITVDHEHNATRDLVRHRENGLLVKPDAPEIAAAIEDLLKSERNEVHYRDFAKQYDWNRTASEVKNIYIS